MSSRFDKMNFLVLLVASVSRLNSSSARSNLACFSSRSWRLRVCSKLAFLRSAFSKLSLSLKARRARMFSGVSN